MAVSTAELIPLLDELSYEDFNAAARFIEYLSSRSAGERQGEDPFYSEKNMAYINGVIDDIESGRSIPKQHDLIEV